MVMLTTTIVYIIRALRWQMLIKATGYTTAFHNAYAALSISYFVSLIIPRLGEVTRCLSIKRHHDIPFMQLLGTVIIERVVDIISLIVMLLLTLVLQFDHIMEFAQENIFQPFYEGIIVKIIAGNSTIIIVTLFVIILICCLFFYFRRYIREKSPKLIVKFVEGLKQGIISISKLQHKKIFILYTILIWLGYYFMTYFWFFVFQETSILGWGACLSIVSIGTIGRSVPIQGGGMGAYHFLVTQVVVLYGVSEVFGKTLATCIHGGQVFFTFAMGLIGLLIFFVSYWKNKN
jgi:glycosyltransferase 2 family protein